MGGGFERGREMSRGRPLFFFQETNRYAYGTGSGAAGMVGQVWEGSAPVAGATVERVAPQAGALPKRTWPRTATLAGTAAPQPGALPY